MTPLRIKNELPATRCEICHQADCFEPETNVCTRCENVPIEVRPQVVFSPRPMFQTFVSGEPFWNSQLRNFLIASLPIYLMSIGFWAGVFDQEKLHYIFLGVALLAAAINFIHQIRALSRKEQTSEIDWIGLSRLCIAGLVAIPLLFYFIVSLFVF